MINYAYLNSGYKIMLVGENQKKKAGLNRKLLGTPRCSWLCIEELIHICDDLRANCACTTASENTNVAEHTRMFTVFVHTLI